MVLLNCQKQNGYSFHNEPHNEVLKQGHSANREVWRRLIKHNITVDKTDRQPRSIVLNNIMKIEGRNMRIDLGERVRSAKISVLHVNASHQHKHQRETK